MIRPTVFPLLSYPLRPQHKIGLSTKLLMPKIWPSKAGFLKIFSKTLHLSVLGGCLCLVNPVFAQTAPNEPAPAISPEVRAKERNVLKQWKTGVQNVGDAISTMLRRALYVVELPDENSPLAERDKEKDKILDEARSALRQLARNTKASMIPPPFPTPAYLQSVQRAVRVMDSIFQQSDEMLLDINNFYVAATRRGMNATEEQLPLRLRLEAMLQDIKNLQLDFLVLLQEPNTLEFRLSDVFARYSNTAALLLHAASDILYSEAPFARHADEARARGYDAFADSQITLDLARDNLQMLRDELDLARATLLQRENLKNRDKHRLKRLYRLYERGIRTLAMLESGAENAQSSIDSGDGNAIDLHVMAFVSLLENKAIRMAELDEERFHELDRLSPGVYPEAPPPPEPAEEIQTDIPSEDQNIIFGNSADGDPTPMPSIENIRDK